MLKSDERTLNRFESLPTPRFFKTQLRRSMIKEGLFIFRWSIGVNLGFFWSFLWNWRNNCFIRWLVWRSLTSESQYSWRTIKLINFEYVPFRMTFWVKIWHTKRHSFAWSATFESKIMTRHFLYWPYSSKFDIWKIYKSYHF